LYAFAALQLVADLSILNIKKTKMKKKYLAMALAVIVMAISFSGCIVERYPHYHHRPHAYYRY